MIWPVHRIPTINTARAGGGSLFDRIDLTLYEIQGFYLEDVDKSSFSQLLWNVLHNDCEKSILLSFSNNQYGEDAFKAFIDFWLLQDFVMDAEKEDYRIISLATSEENEKIPISENETVFPGNISNIWWKDIVSGDISEKTKKFYVMLIGLKMVNISLYNDFVNGKNSKPLMDIYKESDLGEGLCYELLN